jgi:phospholipid transport system substrate-binding protein
MTNIPSLQILIYILIIAIFYPVPALSSNVTEDEPKQIILSMSQQFEDELLRHQKDINNKPSITDDLIIQHLIPNVNFLLMSRYVLGKNWKKASTPQQEEFVQLFKTLLIRFYSKVFVDYLKTNQIETGMTTLLPFRAKSDSKYAKVKTEMKVNSDKPKIQVNYSLYLSKKNGWKIYDISVEGISLVSSYRSSFNQIIKKESMAGLMNHMKNKIEN